MDALMFFAALLVALVGQWLNAKPNTPTPLIKGGMAIVGPIIYLIVDQPKALHGQPFLDWLDNAWVWSLALPGMASLIGVAPRMATKVAAVLFAAIALSLPSASMAQTNLSGVVKMGLSANAIWFEAPEGNRPIDIEAGGNLAASLSPHIAAVGGFYRGFRGAYWRSSVGGRITATDVDNKDFSIHVGIQYHQSTDPERTKEWAPDVSIGARPFPAELPWLIVTAQGARGLKSKEAWGIVGLRAKLPSF